MDWDAPLEDEPLPQSALFPAMGVSKHWHSFLSQTRGPLDIMYPLLTDIVSPMELPHLHCSLTVKSQRMEFWIAHFFHKIHMPHLRILILDGVAFEYDLTEVDFESILQGLTRLPNSDIMESPSSFPELDELHLVNFAPRADTALFHCLYNQMASIKLLTLGPGGLNEYDPLAIALLPTPHGQADLPLPRLRTLIIFDVRKDIVRHVVLERLSLAGPLEELCHHDSEDSYEEEWDEEKQDESVPDDWQHQVEKYYCIDRLKSERYPNTYLPCMYTSLTPLSCQLLCL
ncbi:uncharacterized protein EDB91DRAFT_1254033 [Suillus paluster]|uniref:uncharacterized protein n=1 Tax=Suillus paluster TaxID=48578 RepID=UPI001B864768|nr:uncharacterized protein EDB91DRAFT_1254033 [Suillus paluster]KAG1727065.1 hypothetical protein EDB91DRAFT_1254033 [Suillus paluster]